jgi:DNA-binding FrmR family transcriptional regulator
MAVENKILDGRLASIEGHVRGIRKMLDDGTYCVEILKQSYAVDRALRKFESELLRRHLSTCAPKGFKEGRDGQMVDELTGIFEIARR